ncbi:MAG: LytTR family DNA-binding domain-containing protein [Myxococcota bacterium]
MGEIRVLIADDEELARTNLREALRAHHRFEVVGEATMGPDVVPRVRSLTPDLVLLDIEMPGMNGVSVARELSGLERCPVVVFVTAFSEFAVDAFELCALDYLLKPFDDARFAEMLGRAEQAIALDSQLQLRELERRLDPDAAYLDRLLVRSVGAIRIVPVSEILWFGAGGNYVELHHVGGVDLHRTSLAALERRLDPQFFVRVHRSALLRLSEVRELRVTGAEQSVAVMSNGDEVRVSHNYRDELLRRLEGG